MSDTFPSDIPPDALALADALRPVLHRLFRQIRRENEQQNSGLTLLQNWMLAMIDQHPGISVGELAQMEKLRGPTISGHVKTLEASGMVQRAAPDPLDRRRIGLLVTEQGRNTLERVRQQRRDWLARQLARQSPAAREALQNALIPLSEIGQL